MDRSIQGLGWRWTPLAALGAILLAGCSGDGSRSPTDPAVSPTLGSATIAGEVRSGGAPAGDVDVTVDGQPISARTNAAGRFELDGVAAGDRVVTFSTPSAQAPLAVRDVRSNERIEIEVALAGSHATLKSMHRGGKGATQPLGAEIRPDTWNTNWAGSSGSVTVFLRGTDYQLIDPASVALVGDDPAEPPLLATRARVEGEHLKAQFGKSEVMGLLLEPVLRGETRTIEIDFVLDGVPSSLAATVRIVGPAH
ncbi:MAG: carboxypeptidase regulatory-like domain-containing protein [Thermoanaerobaculia bacterium]|nr:MAG: carboxypeptidase regulatory-like domain-containing protein [Thermoanaerobaculia bacterium]